MPLGKPDHRVKKETICFPTKWTISKITPTPFCQQWADAHVLPWVNVSKTYSCYLGLYR